MSTSFRTAQWNKFFSQLPIGHQKALILAIPLMSLVITISGLLWSRQAEISGQWWISHTEEVIRESSNLQMRLLDAETGIRGYGLTKNREFLQPYQQALTKIPTNLRTLTKLTQDNPIQQQQIQKIQQQTAERLNLFLKTLEIIEENQQNSNLNTQLDTILLESKIKMDRIRESLWAFNHIDSLNPPATFQIKILGKMPVFETESLPLQQVFSNLISNAIKHHPRTDGQIEISVRDFKTNYLFTVRDDGLGIDSKYHQRIFEVFQTLTPRDQKENTGIGLSIVKKIVEKQGGKITLDSQIGQGSSFSFNWHK
jgi:signal transduction histidine kinase